MTFCNKALSEAFFCLFLPLNAGISNLFINKIKIKFSRFQSSFPPHRVFQGSKDAAFGRSLRVLGEDYLVIIKFCCFVFFSWIYMYMYWTVQSIFSEAPLWTSLSTRHLLNKVFLFVCRISPKKTFIEHSLLYKNVSTINMFTFDAFYVCHSLSQTVTIVILFTFLFITSDCFLWVCDIFCAFLQMQWASISFRLLSINWKK